MALVDPYKKGRQITTEVRMVTDILYILLYCSWYEMLVVLLISTLPKLDGPPSWCPVVKWQI